MGGIHELAAGGNTDGDASDRVINEDGSITIALNFPVTVKYRQGGQEREERLEDLTVRRPNGADLRAIGSVKNEVEQALAMLSRLCGKPPSVIDQLDMDDIERAGEIVGGFMSRKTGKTF